MLLLRMSVCILMKKIIQKIRSYVRESINTFTPSETIQESKDKWNRLSEDNDKYYIMSDFGEKIDEVKFEETGKSDYERLIERDPILQQRLIPFGEKTILEVGCGIGRLTMFLGKSFRDVIAVDISEKMIFTAKSRLSAVKNIQCVATNGLTYPAPDKSIDFLFSFIVFQHMPDRETVKKNFVEASRVLKDGGIMKVQLRGVPSNKKEWFYGPSFTLNQVKKMIADLPLDIVKNEGEHEMYFWLWLNKRSTIV